MLRSDASKRGMFSGGGVVLLMLLTAIHLDATAGTGATEFNTGAGSFVFTDHKGDPGKPVKVWYFSPANVAASAPVLFVMHGVQRNGETYRDQWEQYAKQYGALLIVPEFSEKHFPKTAYAQGNMFDSGLQRMPDNRSGFALVEHLFDEVLSRSGNSSSSYYLYGHSAGGQFVHRMLLLQTDARIRRAVAANSGFYTLPRNVEDFPYGLNKSGLAAAAVKKAFAKELIVLLGDRDTLEDQPSLDKSPGAMKQGRYRLARGQNFFKVAQEEADRHGVALAWKLQTVAGAGHSNTRMAGAAAKALLEDNPK